MPYRRLFLLALLAGAGLVAGCASGRLETERLVAEAYRSERDSLRGALAVERVRSEAYADSIRFYDSIDSGEYERTLRTLRDQVERLEFRLAERGGERPVETFPADALFEPASATLSAEGLARLDDLARWLQQQPREASFRVEGHADGAPVGPSLRERFPTNWELAALRAATVARYLISTGLAAERFTVTSRGDVAPVAPNTTAEGRAQNRRVIVYVGQR